MSDEIFDPEIHAVDPKTGEPSLNKDGSFRKKRRDAGRRPAAAKASKGASGSGPAAIRERYRRSVDQTLQIPVTLASLADPVIGFAASNLAPMWSEALADLAVENPRLAAALERAGNLGAVGGVITAAVLTGVQIGHLMGRVPAQMVKMVGGQTREEIEKILEQRGMQMAEQRRAAEAAGPGPAVAFEEAREHAAV